MIEIHSSTYRSNWLTLFEEGVFKNMLDQTVYIQPPSGLIISIDDSMMQLKIRWLCYNLI